MEECTFNFLKKMQNSYLVDFVVKRMTIEDNSKINEQNVIDYLGSVYCFIQLIKDFEEFSQNKKKQKQNLTKSSTLSVNKSIENLQKEIRFKLSKFNYDNCFTKVKKDINQRSMFDEVIKRLANEILDEVNINYEAYHDSTEMNTNPSGSDIKIRKNLRYQQSEA